MTNRIRKLIQLNSRQLRFFCRAWIQIGRVWLRVNYASRDSYLNWLAYYIEEPAIEQSFQLAVIKEQMRLVSVASRNHFVADNCLIRSLAGLQLLSSQGIRGQLRIGVTQTDVGILAHAWIVLDGLVVSDNESNLEKFAIFSSTTEQQQILDRKFEFIG